MKLGNMALAIYVSLANFGFVCILVLVQKFQIRKSWECGTGYFSILCVFCSRNCSFRYLIVYEFLGLWLYLIIRSKISNLELWVHGTGYFMRVFAEEIVNIMLV